ncbi:CM1 [Symbiodinium pilosum]|uniref:chorismate mutase n=1 Tax=Symbiodinium pilosum TaxID=2952 RepID=A0A812TPC5_SYMPI|nr:CM1 [Symbiodinium pilosum]
MIQARDEDGLTDFITKPEVEKRNVQRVILKAKAFSRNIGGQAAEGDGENTTYKVNPEYVGTVFQDYIMPLTKEVEVAYLLARLDETPRPGPEQESTAWFGTASGSGRLKKTLQEDFNVRADQL